uniref:NADH dehydrogenase subunit 6 n=1 Tax=Daphnia galeata TaxID=27404 RepID=A0A1S7J0C3_9CRUS|nr:NADH dehydrogenase subunit 6 [Daphnia galeata]WBR65260.1 NADH dehydrogenase subunit 6 [Daphnia galeata]BAX01980.1 NADH dehydrogenase subunit 6 [Daphnia galeata]BAX01993.1 NADH dehydrogenase subunit 6 [Daphnia galeata]BAX02019.1 NADH dehydrogenase subunit 6 [Daphnia galeata]BAX02032.1 NADH dehydrogenase subunit 6 [Daphnia galeata]
MMEPLLFFFSSLLVFIFPMANHPLMMGLIILVLTITMAAEMALFGISTWLSYILILILLGGLLVIFIYISLLAPNENQVTFGVKKMLVVVALSTLPMLFISLNLETWTSKSNAFSPLSNDTENLSWLNLFYSSDLGSVTMFLVLYLFLTLIIVIFISKTNSSSLRSS